MIVDRIENWNVYFDSGSWTRAFEFLSALDPGVEEGEIPLDGERLFARVMSYSTKNPEAAALESHLKYADIQTALIGAEAIDWFPRQGLTVKTPYDPEKDVEFYHRLGPSPLRVDVTPGVFAVLFPGDAHMPQLVPQDGSNSVKKVVVKVQLDSSTI